MTWLSAELPPDIPAACVVQAADRYSVPIAALVSVLKQEGGALGKAYPRSSGVYFGPYQISDKWTSHFAQWNITASELQHSGCWNAVAGAYVLAYYKAREPDWFNAIARYNVGSLSSPKQREAGYRYAHAVMNRWQRLYARWGTVAP